MQGAAHHRRHEAEEPTTTKKRRTGNCIRKGTCGESWLSLTMPTNIRPSPAHSWPSTLYRNTQLRRAVPCSAGRARCLRAKGVPASDGVWSSTVPLAVVRRGPYSSGGFLGALARNKRPRVGSASAFLQLGLRTVIPLFRYSHTTGVSL